MIIAKTTNSFSISATSILVAGASGDSPRSVVSLGHNQAPNPRLKLEAPRRQVNRVAEGRITKIHVGKLLEAEKLEAQTWINIHSMEVLIPKCILQVM